MRTSALVALSLLALTGCREPPRLHGLRFVLAPPSLQPQCHVAARAVGYAVPCPTRVPAGLTATGVAGPTACRLEIVGAGGLGGCARSWRGWVVGSSWVGRQHLVITGSPRPLTSDAKLVNGPAWYPKARLRPPLCERCGAPTAWPVRRCAECAGRRLAFASARAAVAYEGVVRAFVGSWKERGLRKLAALAADVVVEAVERPSAAVLTFVPPDGDRSLKRGHHPAERLARELGERWELPVEPLLRRARPVQRQRGLSLAARQANLRGAFRAAGQAPMTVAVVDDVYTSGATATAAATALRKSGTRCVSIVTFARAIR